MIFRRKLRNITPGQVLPKSWEVFSDSPLASPEKRMYEESMRSSSGNNVRLILLATKVMYLSPGTEANFSPPLLPNKDDHIFPGGRLLHHLRRTLQLSKDELCMHKSGSADLKVKVFRALSYESSCKTCSSSTKRLAAQGQAATASFGTLSIPR